MVTLLVLLDFTKAFDSIPYSHLFSKLSTFRFSKPILAWLRSYLSERFQRVRGFNDLFVLEAYLSKCLAGLRLFFIIILPSYQ